MARKWLSRAFGRHPGALHKALGVPKGTTIPMARLMALRKRLMAKKNKTAKDTKMLRRIGLAMRAKKGEFRGD